MSNLELDTIVREVGNCTGCPLHQWRRNTVPGEGHADAGLMIVGEAPGEHEDEQGRPFVGPSGDLLNKLLERAGIDRTQVYITNVLKCRPPQNRDPAPSETGACRRHLARQIQAIDPKVIVTLGKHATWNVTGTVGSMGALLESEGLKYDNSIPVVPMYHPSYLLRLGWDAAKPTLQDALNRLRKAKKLVSVGS